MHRPKPLLTIALAALLVVPPPAFSWGNQGHELVGAIADAALAKDTKVLGRLHALFGSSFHLRDIATCADRIRDFVRATEKEERSKTKTKNQVTLDPACAPFIAKFSKPAKLPSAFPHSDKWHFINTPIGAAHTVDDIMSFCGADLCAPDRIQHYHDLLAPTASRAVQAESILFLTHLVGDLHQPLHSADRNKDAGGNAIFVTFFGASFPLHHVWDDEVIARMTDGHGNRLPNDAARLQHLTANLPSPGPFMPLQWALDAFEAARKTSYINAGAPLVNGSVPAIPDVRQEPGTTLHDAAYLAAADPVVQKQLQLAGVRLAAILHDQLGK